MFMGISFFEFGRDLLMSPVSYEMSTSRELLFDDTNLLPTEVNRSGMQLRGSGQLLVNFGSGSSFR